MFQKYSYFTIAAPLDCPMKVLYSSTTRSSLKNNKYSELTDDTVKNMNIAHNN